MAKNKGKKKSTSDTTTKSTINNIDAKKGKTIETTDTTKKGFEGFFYNYFYLIVFGILLGVVLIGSMGLYLTKVAYADILPTNINLEPYVESSNVNKSELMEEVIKRAKIVTMNPVKIRGLFGFDFWNEPIETYSQKAYFDFPTFIKSFKKSWITKLRNNSKPGNIFSNFNLFLYEVLSQMTASSFDIITNIFQILNYLPEWLTMLVTLFFGLIIGLFIYGYNFVVGIFYHIMNLKEYFRSESWTQPDTWESDSQNPLLMMFWWWKPGITKIIMFMFVWWWVTLISVFVSPLFVTLYTLITPLTATYKLEKGTNNTYNFWSFIKDNVIYKKSFLLVLATLGLINSTQTYLGNAYLFGLFIGILIVAFYFKIYTTNVPSGDPTETLGTTIDIKDDELTKMIKQIGGKLKSNKNK
jgi:hypothetical protein